MAFNIEHPLDVNEQLLEYAEHGHVMDVPTSSSSHSVRNCIVAIAIATLLLIAGVSLVVSSTSGTESTTNTVAGMVLALIGVSLLTAAVHRLKELATTSAIVELRPGAVIPPELVKAGNWLRRNGTWVRVNEIGFDRTGQVSALVSSGDLIYLDSPVTIAGDVYRKSSNPVSDLAR